MIFVNCLLAIIFFNVCNALYEGYRGMQYRKKTRTIAPGLVNIQNDRLKFTTSDNQVKSEIILRYCHRLLAPVVNDPNALNNKAVLDMLHVISIAIDTCHLYNTTDCKNDVDSLDEVYKKIQEFEIEYPNSSQMLRV